MSDPIEDTINLGVALHNERERRGSEVTFPDCPGVTECGGAKSHGDFQYQQGAKAERERIDSLLDMMIGIWQKGSSIHAETVFDVLCELRATIEETAHV